MRKRADLSRWNKTITFDFAFGGRHSVLMRLQVNCKKRGAAALSKNSGAAVLPRRQGMHTAARQRACPRLAWTFSRRSWMGRSFPS